MPEEISSHPRTGYTAEQPTVQTEVGPTEPVLARDTSSRRRRRQTITFLVLVAIVLSIGLVGLTYYYGLWGGSDDSGARSCPTGPGLPPPGEVSMNVYNGSDRSGLALRASQALDKRKFRVGDVANDPQQQQIRGTAVIRHGAEGTLAAKTVAAHLKGKPRLEQDDERTGDIVDLVLGAKYAGLRTSKDAAKRVAAAAPKAGGGSCPSTSA